MTSQQQPNRMLSVLAFFFFNLRKNIWIRARVLNAPLPSVHRQVTEFLCFSTTFCQQPCRCKQLPPEHFPPIPQTLMVSVTKQPPELLNWFNTKINKWGKKKPVLKTGFSFRTWFHAQSCRSGSSVQCCNQKELKTQFVSLYPQTWRAYSIRKENGDCWEHHIPVLMGAVTQLTRQVTLLVADVVRSCCH